MGKIGELLSDEESVRQLSELAQMMMNDTGAKAPRIPTAAAAVKKARERPIQREQMTDCSQKNLI